MGISEIRPGMVGIGRTVFDGTHVEEFKANILGVLENVIGTRRNLILARLEGGPLANTGVIAGMSGSPVYIDGKLIGAVSYSLGSFSKEPIAGITPIAEMTDATSFGDARPAGARVSVEFPLTRENLTAAFRKALNWNRPFAERPDDARYCRHRRRWPASRGRRRARHAAAPDCHAARHVRLRAGPGRHARRGVPRAGIRPTGGGAAGLRPGEKPFEGPLKPGDAVGVMLVGGDLELGATGTVTHIDDDRVYAFGHPLYNLGPTAFPMTRAYVYTVIPSLAASMKLSTTGEVIGAFTQDRAAAIAGRLGPGPKMIPVTVALDADRAPKRTFRFELANDQMFTPLMAAAAISNTLASYERQYGTSTFYVRGTAKVTRSRADCLRQRLRGRTAVDQRVHVHRRAARRPARQRLREGRHRGHRSDDRFHRGIRRPRRSSACGSTISGRAPGVPRRSKCCMRTLARRGTVSHRADRDPVERHRHAVGAWSPTAIGSPRSNSAKRARRSHATWTR